MTLTPCYKSYIYSSISTSYLKQRCFNGSNPYRIRQAFPGHAPYRRHRDHRQGQSRSPGHPLHRGCRQRPHLQPGENPPLGGLLRAGGHVGRIHTHFHSGHRQPQDTGRRRRRGQLRQGHPLQPPGPGSYRRRPQGQGHPAEVRHHLHRRRQHYGLQGLRRHRQAGRRFPDRINGRQRRRPHPGQAGRSHRQGARRQAGTCSS